MLETTIQWTCDGCGKTEVWPEMNVTRQAVRATLRLGGFRHYGGLDYCPDCVANGLSRLRETNRGLGDSQPKQNAHS